MGTSSRLRREPDDRGPFDSSVPTTRRDRDESRRVAPSYPATNAAGGLMKFANVWAVPDGHVASGRVPGYAGAVRVRGETESHAGGRMAVEPDRAPMRDDTLFRIASLTKPLAGALTLALVE